ncbi:MAG TPA: nitroreductase family protein [Paenirhodobacter sp.]
MANAVINVLTQRRTCYALSNTLPISAVEVDALIREAIRLAPSSFNSQSSRAVILFGAESVKLWNIVRETLRKIVPVEAFASTDKKMDSFAAGAGTVLFYEDKATIDQLQTDYPLYASNFPVFSEQSGGMAQLAVWQVLADLGVGASLQHYNPLPDEEIAKTWGVPASWALRAQMPFGVPTAQPGPKTFIDDAIRFKTAF